jgi:non-ribosomal peptide synthetase component F
MPAPTSLRITCVQLAQVPKCLVGIFLENSVEMIVSLLAVLKSGAAYVPLDTKYPAERLRLMLQDTRMPLLITERRLAPKLPHLELGPVSLVWMTSTT